MFLQIFFDTHFRFVPTVSTNYVTNSIEVSFQPVTNTMVLLENAMELLEKVSTKDKKLIVVFDEFQEILNIRKGLDKQMRSIMNVFGLTLTVLTVPSC